MYILWPAERAQSDLRPAENSHQALPAESVQAGRYINRVNPTLNSRINPNPGLAADPSVFDDGPVHSGPLL